MTKKVFIRTLGCQMNDRDSEALAGLFLTKGYSLVEDFNEADVILVNTCSVREHAESRALSFLGSLKKIKQSTSLRVIGLIGCMAQNLGESIAKKMPHIDLVCGPANLDRIPDYIDKIRNERVRIVDVDYRERDESFYKAFYRSDPNRAQVVISMGCSNYCSYCVVPYVRGSLYLRSLEAILEEVKMNVDLGINKITLLGQNVNDYREGAKGRGQGSMGKRQGEEGTDFVDLLKMVSSVEGVKEIDFLTSHPKNITKDLFYLIAERSNIKKHLHLPFQSGSDRILKLMNRGYSRQDYLNIVEDYKDIVKGTLSSDVIVGFPTETDDDFNQTKELLEEVEFKSAYLFKYSPRLGTEAVKLQDDVPEEVKNQRHRVLLSLQKQISLRV